MVYLHFLQKKPNFLSLPTKSSVFSIVHSVFTEWKGLNCQNHSSSGSHHLVKQFPPAKFPIPPTGGEFTPYPLPLFGKPCSGYGTEDWCYHRPQNFAP